MSIKFVHIIFIVLAILVGFLFGVWSWNNGVNRIVSIFSFLTAIGLSIYVFEFCKKMRGW